MAKKTSRPKGEITAPKLVVEKKVASNKVDEIAAAIGELTYGQCLVLKIAIDRRLASTRARKG
jgi:hypothetical protein